MPSAITERAFGLYNVAWSAFWLPWYPFWQGIDFADTARRLRCYELHSGLAHFVYNAYVGNWPVCEQTVARTLAIVDAAAA